MLCFRFDKRSLYFEQRFVSMTDNFVRCVAICENTAVPSEFDVVEAIENEFGFKRPSECPQEVKLFIESDQSSSKKLREEAKLVDDARQKKKEE